MGEMTKYAVIVAGGAGSRMGAPVPKQFLLLRGKPVLWYTLNTFLSAYDDLMVVLVVPAGYREQALALAGSTVAPARVGLVEGGSTRFESVRKGLGLIERGARPGGAKPIVEESVIFVHDGVRCLVSEALIHRCYEQALRRGSAIPVVDPKDSVRLLTDEGNAAIDRSRVKLVQTPQTFLSGLLVPAYRAAYHAGFTDEATVVEAAGHPIHLIEGEVNNIKITLPADLAFADQLLESRL